VERGMATATPFLANPHAIDPSHLTTLAATNGMILVVLSDQGILT